MSVLADDRSRSIQAQAVYSSALAAIVASRTKLARNMRALAGVPGSSSGHLPLLLDPRAMALLAICDTSFTCEDYNTYRGHPGSHFALRRAHPGPNVNMGVCAGVPGSAPGHLPLSPDLTRVGGNVPT